MFCVEMFNVYGWNVIPWPWLWRQINHLWWVAGFANLILDCCFSNLTDGEFQWRFGFYFWRIGFVLDRSGQPWQLEPMQHFKLLLVQERFSPAGTWTFTKPSLHYKIFSWRALLGFLCIHHHLKQTDLTFSISLWKVKVHRDCIYFGASLQLLLTSWSTTIVELVGQGGIH